MAKRQETPVDIRANDISELLTTIPKLPTVYKWDQVLNRAFVVNSVDATVFDNGGERTNIHVTMLSDGEPAIIECAAKGVTIPVWAAVDAGLLPFRAKIIQRGKFPELASA